MPAPAPAAGWPRRRWPSWRRARAACSPPMIILYYYKIYITYLSIFLKKLLFIYYIFIIKVAILASSSRSLPSACAPRAAYLTNLQAAGAMQDTSPMRRWGGRLAIRLRAKCRDSRASRCLTPTRRWRQTARRRRTRQHGTIRRNLASLRNEGGGGGVGREWGDGGRERERGRERGREREEGRDGEKGRGRR